MPTHLLKKSLWGALRLGWVLTVPHLHASEAHPCVVLADNLKYSIVAVMLGRVVVSSRELSRVRLCLEPPVHAGDLHTKAAAGVELIRPAPAATLLGEWNKSVKKCRPTCQQGMTISLAGGLYRKRCVLALFNRVHDWLQYSSLRGVLY